MMETSNGAADTHCGTVGPGMIRNSFGDFARGNWNAPNGRDRRLISSWYSVTIHVVPNLPLISKQKFHFSMRPMYQNITLVLVSTLGWEQREWSPCISSMIRQPWYCPLSPIKQYETRPSLSHLIPILSRRRIWCAGRSCSCKTEMSRVMGDGSTKKRRQDAPFPVGVHRNGICLISPKNKF